MRGGAGGGCVEISSLTSPMELDATTTTITTTSSSTGLISFEEFVAGVAPVASAAAAGARGRVVPEEERTQHRQLEVGPALGRAFFFGGGKLW